MLKRLDNTNGIAKVNNGRLESLESFRSEIKGKMWGLGIAFTLIMAFVNILVKIFLK